MAITLTSEKTYYKGSLKGSPPSGSGYKYGQAGGDGYGGAYCTVYQLKTTTPISDFTFKAKAISDNTGSSKYLGVYVTTTANSAYLNCYGGKSGITTHTYLRFGYTCTNKGSFTSSTGNLWGTAKVTGLAIPAGTFYVYLFPYQALTTTTNSTWYGPTTDSSSNRATFTGSWTKSTYTISYDANGGTGAPSSQTKYQGISLTLSSTKSTKADTTTNPTGTIKISYDANGGSSTPSAGTGTYTNTKTVSYTFKNWNTSSGGTGTAYSSGAAYTANAAATLYAQYDTSTEEVRTTNPSIKTASAISRTNGTETGYKVTFNANGGSSTPGAITSTKTIKYSFSKWKNLNSGTEFSASTSYTFSANATLTAQWTSTSSNNAITLPAAINRSNAVTGTYTITYNANGGTCSKTSEAIDRVSSYAFGGWNTKADGSGTNYNASSSYTPSTATTLYAKWNITTTTNQTTLPTPTRSGYKFLGWAESTTASSGVTGSYTPTKTLTLYAIWEALGSVKIKTEDGIHSYIPFIYTKGKWTRAVPFVYKQDKGWIRSGGG